MATPKKPGSTYKIRSFPEGRICKQCEVMKPYSEYHRNKSRTASGSAKDGGYMYQCKTCCRKLDRERLYGLPFDDHDAFFANGCAMCGATEKLCVDHCHTEGTIRGCLCNRCNTAVGFYETHKDKIYDYLA